MRWAPIIIGSALFSGVASRAIPTSQGSGVSTAELGDGSSNLDSISQSTHDPRSLYPSGIDMASSRAANDSVVPDRLTIDYPNGRDLSVGGQSSTTEESAGISRSFIQPPPSKGHSPALSKRGNGTPGWIKDRARKESARRNYLRGYRGMIAAGGVALGVGGGVTYLLKQKEDELERRQDAIDAIEAPPASPYRDEPMVPESP
jgi:hypothetical protein